MRPSLQLLLMGDNIEDAEAHRVMPQARLLVTAEEGAEKLLQRGLTALACTKEVAVRCSTLPLPDAVRMGEALRRLARTVDDAGEDGRARREKRQPLWTGH